jgi:hypothetical protein
MAGAKCSICPHPERGNAEKAIAAGVSVRAAAKLYNLPYASLDRHQRNCARKAIAKVREKQDLATGKEGAKVEDAVVARETKLATDLVARVEELQSITTRIIRSAMGNEEKPALPVLALKAVAQARKNLELIGRLTGTLEPEPQKDTQLITFESFELMYRRVRLGRDK